MLSKTFTVLLGIYQILASQIQQPKLWCSGQAILYLQDVSSYPLYKNLGFEELPILNIDRKLYNPTNIPRGFQVEMMRKRSFQRGIHQVCLQGINFFFICSIRVGYEMQNYVGRTFNNSELYSQLLKYSKIIVSCTNEKASRILQKSVRV